MLGGEGVHSKGQGRGSHRGLGFPVGWGLPERPHGTGVETTNRLVRGALPKWPSVGAAGNAHFFHPGAEGMAG